VDCDYIVQLEIKFGIRQYRLMSWLLRAEADPNLNILSRTTSMMWKIMEFCTSAVSVGSHVALFQHQLSFRLFLRVTGDRARSSSGIVAIFYVFPLLSLALASYFPIMVPTARTA